MFTLQALQAAVCYQYFDFYAVVGGLNKSSIAKTWQIKLSFGTAWNSCDVIITTTEFSGSFAATSCPP